MINNLPNLKITIKNYRCFSDQYPAIISVKEGFTSFVGTNNSGKSTLLKFFYEFRDLFVRLALAGNFTNAFMGSESFVLPDSTKDIEELFCNINQRDISIEFTITDYTFEPKTEGLLPGKVVVQIPRGTNKYFIHLFLEGQDITPQPVVSVSNAGANHLKIGQILFALEPYFIMFKQLSQIVYIGPFRNAVNIGGTINYYDMVIGQQFIKLWDDYKSGPLKHNTNAALKLTEDIKNIFGFTTLEVNASTDNQTLHVIINGKPYRLEELGSGVAQFIVILSNIAIKQPSWVLIDEPELNLHPSLQIDFLTTLGAYAANGIMFSTHNIGLARACSEQIYSFRVNEANQISVGKFDATPDLAEFLGELSYSSYRDLGFDKIVLVEGTTEVKTIQQFLRKYYKDHQIVLLSLGGSDFINSKSETGLNEIKRITNNLFALIDSERDSPGALLSNDRQQFCQICKALNIQCTVLQYRATDNYLSDRAVKAIKGAKYHSLEPYQKLADSSPTWGKQENWLIAREMTLQEIEGTDLGKFFEKL